MPKNPSPIPRAPHRPQRRVMPRHSVPSDPARAGGRSSGGSGRSSTPPACHRGLARVPVVTERVPYDEFAYFHENAEEFGIPYDGPPVVRRTAVDVGDGRALSALV